MRFCLLTTFFPPQHFGGDAVLTAHLANALTAAGHEVHVVHCADSFDVLRGDVPESQFPLDPRITVYPMRSLAGPLSPLLTYFTGRPLLKERTLRDILAQDFDVVHWHNISLLGPGALKLGKGVRLCTLHDYWFDCPTSLLFKNDREACIQRSCIRCTLAHKRIPAPWRAGNFLGSCLEHVDRFLTPSRFAAGRYRSSSLAIDPLVVPNFVPPATRIEPPSRGNYYLFAGRLVRAKGLQTIIPLFVASGRRLLVAGAGEFEGELRHLAGAAPNIEFLGRVPVDRMASLYSGARATLVPSVCYEVFGLTVLESLQQGTPVITSNFGALPELVAQTGGGCVYSNTAELKEILDRFDADACLADELGETGLRNLGDFTPEVHLKSYLGIIEEIKHRRS